MVEKFEFDMTEYFTSHKIEKKYPLLLPYSKSVVKILELLETYLGLNLDYWQFLLSSTSDYTLVSSSCDRILLQAATIYQQQIDESLQKSSVL